jgi:hypothetical protein
LGHVTKGSIRVDDEDWGVVSTYKKIHEESLGNLIDS